MKETSYNKSVKLNVELGGCFILVLQKGNVISKRIIKPKKRLKNLSCSYTSPLVLRLSAAPNLLSITKFIVSNICLESISKIYTKKKKIQE